MSVRPSNRSHGTIRLPLMKFDTTVFFKKLSTEFKFHENLTRIMGTLHEDICTF